MLITECISEYYVVAGNGTSVGYVDGTGTNARFNNMGGIDVSTTNILYVADSSNNVIRTCTTSGKLTYIIR
jgi:hypothetical protein